jgi:hypothetical protein
VGLAALLSLALLVTACSVDVPTVATPDVPVGTSRLENLQDDTPAGAPEDEGFDSRTLIALTEWIRDHRVPIFSFLISRNGTLVYELYTSSLTRAQAHYQMSVTKSVVSALIGVSPRRRCSGRWDSRTTSGCTRIVRGSTSADTA